MKSVISNLYFGENFKFITCFISTLVNEVQANYRKLEGKNLFTRSTKNITLMVQRIWLCKHTNMAMYYGLCKYFWPHAMRRIYIIILSIVSVSIILIMQSNY